jgi:hypothetical protein
MNWFNIHISVLIFVVFSSCRKDVTVKLPEYKQKLVVEASIENGLSPVVLLSTSVPFFGSFDLTAPQDAFVKGAFVTVSDGILTDTLKELIPGVGYAYTGSKITGQQGKTYTLRIKHGEVDCSLSSTILNPVKLDSLYFKWEQDSLGFIWQRFNEPAGLGNNYRWFAKRLNAKYQDNFFAAPLFSVFDDKFVDGKGFDYSYDRGPQPDKIQQWRDESNRSFFRVGDTVVVKFTHIGRNEYMFWNTYYQNKASNSNPFSAPVNIQNMYVGREDVFGSFTAYSPFFDTLVVKPKP